MAKWHIYLFSALFFIPFRLGRFQNPPANPSLDSAVVDSEKELPCSSALGKATAETLSASDLKRRKLSPPSALPPHDVPAARLPSGDLGPRAQAAESSKAGVKGRNLKKPSSNGHDEAFKSIDQQIIQVMAINEVGSSGQGSPICQPVSREITSKVSQLAPSQSPRNSIAALQSVLTETTLSRSELDKHPEIQTLHNYLTFLAQAKKGISRKPAVALQRLVDWNLQAPHVSQEIVSHVSQVPLRKYLVSYLPTHRLKILPSWSDRNSGAFPSVPFIISEQAGINRCQLLKIMSQLDEVTAEINLREGTCRQQVRASNPHSKERTLLAGYNRELLKVREEFITFSLAGFISVLYAVFTPFDSANVLEMRGKLLALMSDLKEIFLHWRLGQHAQHFLDIANTRTFSLSTEIAGFFLHRSQIQYTLNKVVAKILSWWCYQQNSKAFCFMYGPDYSRSAKSGFLALLKDCLFISNLELN